MKKKQVALFGGAFDPVHNGHIQVASVVATDYIDEVWFVPVYIHPWAEKYGKEVLAPYIHRMTMLQMVLGENQRIAEYLDVSYAFPTLNYFSQKYPDSQFSWIMGSEYISRFDAFLEGHPRLAEYTCYVYPRDGYPLEGFLSNMVGLYEMEKVTVSSTQIKELCAVGHDISALVPPQVATYISKHGLYRDAQK